MKSNFSLKSKIFQIVSVLILFSFSLILPCFPYASQTIKVEGSEGSGQNIASVDTTGYLFTTQRCGVRSRITSAVSALVIKNAPGVLHAVIVGTKGVNARITLWDNATVASGFALASLDVSSVNQTYVMDEVFNNGLVADVSAYSSIVSVTPDIVVCTT